MENAVDALKIGFAVFVFVMALSLTLYMFSKATTTADIVLHSSDITEYMQYEEVGADSENRVVGLETIIPTLYKYYKENYTVIFRDTTGSFLEIYESNQNFSNKYYRGRK